MGELPAPVRLRLVFENRSILTKRQRSAGMKCCWLLLRPELSSVSDVADHIAKCFELHQSCPDGISLYMEDFMLPPFEVTGIFKDKDVIGVRKKPNKLRYCIENDDEAKIIEDSPLTEKRPLLLWNKLTEVKDVKECSLNDQSNEAQDGRKQLGKTNGSKTSPSKQDSGKRKRKHSDRLHIIKIKKKKVNISEKQTVTSNEGSGVIFKEEAENCHLHIENNDMNGKTIHRVSEIVSVVQSDVSDTDDDSVENVHIDVRNDQLDTIEKENEGDLGYNKVEKKTPSRSARRKKAKRQWLRQQASAEKKVPIQNHLPGKDTPIQNCLSEKDTHEQSQESPKVVHNAEDDSEFVPIIVRPGHIRFDCLDTEGTELQKHDQGYLQWNGTVDKKKGQKWGKEKIPKIKSNDSEQHNYKPVTEEDAVAGPIDFEKLASLTRMPKLGEVVAYRLLELSSSWCPEISSFRVGKVASIDPVSMNVILVPLPGFLVPVEKRDEECPLEPNASLYKEDGSLEIDFSSLIDIRLVDTTTSDGWAELVKDGSTNNCEMSSEEEPDETVKCVTTPNSVREKSRDWDEIDQALMVKKAELMREKGGGQRMEPSVPPKWSYRALRGSALGPTISRLRANMDL